MRSYVVEFRDDRCEAISFNGHYELDDLTRDRAHVISARYVNLYPDRMCFIHLEVQKPNKTDRQGRSHFASRIEGVTEYRGRGYHGPRPRSTMQRKGRIDSDVSVIRPGR